MKTNKKNNPLVSPEALRQARAKILTDNSPYAFKESYVRLRTNLMFSLATVGTGKCKVIAVTSANPGEGKTTTALNIAISFAMLNKKVLVIDSDMRRPQLSATLNVSGENGFSNLLGGVDECFINRAEELGVDFITSGKIPPNPAELLASAAFEHYMNKLKSEYDYIVIDTPPVNTVADAQIVASKVDGVVVVVRAEKTRYNELLRAEEVLGSSGGKVIGIVANDLESKSGKYGNYKGYRKYYNYYKKYE